MAAASRQDRKIERNLIMTTNPMMIGVMLVGLFANLGLIADRSYAEDTMTLKITSTDFADQGEIPSTHTCEGDDSAPALQWEGVPGGTKSLALIVDDPDAPDPAAPRMTWVHWVLYNLPPDSGGLPGAVASPLLPAGTMEGKNDWGRTGYGGPCPPIGRHRYFHKLYALDAILPDLKKPNKASLEAAMKGHIIEQAELVGTYQKSR